ncbi:MAG: hypothetical protein WC756_10475 [Taibaiella sp.]|jgi:hypothetical protein
MKFLNHLALYLKNTFNKKFSFLIKKSKKVQVSFDPTVESTEPLARFITDKKKNIYATGKVRPNAFHPHPERRDLSVYRTKNISDQEIWFISDKFCTAARPDKPAVARAEIPANLPPIHSLRLVPDGNPHPRHLNIEDFPPLSSPALTIIKTQMANEAMTYMRAD